MARELTDEALGFFRGIYLMTPFAYYDMTASLTRHIRRLTHTETKQR
jgi:homocysteine S-methyltransferase